MDDRQIDTVLEFPEGDFLITSRPTISSQGIYFMQPGSDKAYLGWGPENELMGKIHRRLPSSCEQFKEYDVTYEIEDDALIAARLITPFSKSAGQLAAPSKVKKLNDNLQNGTLQLVGKYSPPAISCAARLPNGETLLVVEGLKEQDYDYSLFIGQPGNFEEFTLTKGLQGGRKMIWTGAETGNKLEYIYRGSSSGGREKPSYGDDILAYIELDDYEDLTQFGLEVDTPDPHLDPFSPELSAP